MAATTLSDRAIVRVSGDDVRGFVQGLVTNDAMVELPVWTGLLTPQGKCLFDFLIWADGDDLLLDCEAEAADDLIKRLSIYRLRRKIKIELDGRFAVHWHPEKVAPALHHNAIDSGPWPPKVVRDPRLEDLGWRWLAPADEVAEGWLEHRLRHGVCEGRAELGDILWLECNAAELNGVNFTKGCYVGQENTARMNWRAKVNRRLVIVPTGDPGPRSRIFYERLGLSVEHRRVDDLDGAIIPKWLEPALAPVHSWPGASPES
jgi:folate-binding protein YgfZ